MKLSNKWVKEIATMAIALIGVFSFRHSIAEPYVVPTGSMIPTILPGDRLFVLKSAYDIKFPFSDSVMVHMNEPQRGDVIVFKYPEDPKTFFVKRLIGLPGDNVVIKNGWIEINGHNVDLTPADQKNLLSLTSDAKYYNFFKESIDGKNSHLIQRLSQLRKSENLEFKIPVDHFFFMGDNRDNSNDSRYWGFVPRSYLKGKALVIWLSLDSENSVIPKVRWNRFGASL